MLVASLSKLRLPLLPPFHALMSILTLKTGLNKHGKIVCLVKLTSLNGLFMLLDFLAVSQSHNGWLASVNPDLLVILLKSCSGTALFSGAARLLPSEPYSDGLSQLAEPQANFYCC